MRVRQTLPDLWLLSDERNDAALERALRRLPRGSGFIYRHYHLAPAERRRRFEELVRIARKRGHIVIVAGTSAWGAAGTYGALPSSRRTPGSRATGAGGIGTRPRLSPKPRGILLAAAHSLHEIGLANRARADAVLLSPAFPTRSHPGAKALGPLRFRLLASHARMPVIALGGMTPRIASRLAWPRWAAIDGLS
jgi:thiamine-phosphate pyrophosphorylase